MYIENKVCVVGLGYIGLPLACFLAKHDIEVHGVDINKQVVSSLKKGNSHIVEPGLDELLQSALNSSKLTINEKPKAADVFIIAVQTPVDRNKDPDLSNVKAAIESVVPLLEPGNLLLLESTVPPGTILNLVAPILENLGFKVGEEILLAYSPERILPGQMLSELEENSRVVGGYNLASAEAGKDLYSVFVKGEIVITDCTTAEMVKLMENSFRDTNIAIANEFARISDLLGVDVFEAIEIANYHPRVNIITPGIGVGGHCISVDPWFLVNAAAEKATLIKTARHLNDSQPRFFVNTIKRTMGKLSGLKVCALGLTYKSDIDDIRESPAIDVVSILNEKGAKIKAFDPFVKSLELPGISLNQSLEEAVFDADIILILVAHTAFQELSPDYLTKKTDCKIIFDPVNNCLKNDWQSAGFKIFSLSNSDTLLKE